MKTFFAIITILTILISCDTEIPRSKGGSSISSDESQPEISGSTPALAYDWREKCNTAKSIAETSMNARQAGIPLELFMQMIEGKFEDSQYFVEKTLVVAYEAPIFETEARQKLAIQKFGEEMYLQCAKKLVVP